MPFQSELPSWGWCLTSSMAPADRHSTDGPTVCPSQTLVLSLLPNLFCDFREQRTLTIDPSAFHPFARLGGTTEPGTNHSFKIYCVFCGEYPAVKTESVWSLMEGPPCHIPNLNILLAAGGWICQQTLSCAGWWPGPWPSWSWALRVAKPGLQPGAFSTSSFWPSSPRSLSEWTKEAQFTHPSGLSSKISSSKKASMIPPAIPHPLRSQANSSLYPRRLSLTTLSKRGLPPPTSPVSSCKTASQHLPQSESCCLFVCI